MNLNSNNVSVVHRCRKCSQKLDITVLSSCRDSCLSGRGNRASRKVPSSKLLTVYIHNSTAINIQSDTNTEVIGSNHLNGTTEVTGSSSGRREVSSIASPIRLSSSPRRACLSRCGILPFWRSLNSKELTARIDFITCVSTTTPLNYSNFNISQFNGEFRSTSPPISKRISHLRKVSSICQTMSSWLIHSVSL